MNIELPPRSITRIKLTEEGPQCVEMKFEGMSNTAKLGAGEKVTVIGIVDNSISDSGTIAFFNSNNTNAEGIPSGAKLSPIKNITGTTAINEEGTGTVAVQGEGTTSGTRRSFRFKFSYEQLFDGVTDTNSNHATVHALQLNGYLGGMRNADAKCVVYITKDTDKPSVLQPSPSPATTTPTTVPNDSSTTSAPAPSTQITPTNSGGGYAVEYSPSTPPSSDTPLPDTNINEGIILTGVAGIFAIISAVVTMRRNTFEDNALNHVKEDN